MLRRGCGSEFCRGRSWHSHSRHSALAGHQHGKKPVAKLGEVLVYRTAREDQVAATKPRQMQKAGNYDPCVFTKHHLSSPLSEKQVKVLVLRYVP